MAPVVDETQLTGRELRWLADNYEQAQQLRIETGERIRAVVQGRDETFIPIGVFYDPDEQGTGEWCEGQSPEVQSAVRMADLEAARVQADGDVERLWISPSGEVYTAESALKAIGTGKTIGPVPMLGRSFRRYRTEEHHTRKLMSRALENHPAWEFCEAVTGIGATLAAKLLARLDPREAPYCSSFWKYCGLATVPGRRYRCKACGLVRGFPADFSVSGDHKALKNSPAVIAISHGEEAATSEVAAVSTEQIRDALRAAARGLKLPVEVEDSTIQWVRDALDAGRSDAMKVKDPAISYGLFVEPAVHEGQPCRGDLKEVAGPDDGVRVAQPSPRKGEKASYDQYAKKVMWQIATSIIRAGARFDSPYERYYRRERRKAEQEKPGWSDGRKEHKARRKMEKLFLSHLWEVWRGELGLDTPDPYILEHGDGEHRYVGPWEFLEGEAV